MDGLRKHGITQTQQATSAPSNLSSLHNRTKMTWVVWHLSFHNTLAPTTCLHDQKMYRVFSMQPLKARSRLSKVPSRSDYVMFQEVSTTALLKLNTPQVSPRFNLDD